MKFTGKYKHLALMAGMAPLAFYSGGAQAQTVTVDTDVVVQNSFTLTVVDNLDFGKIIAISDAVKIATQDIDADTGASAFGTTGAPAVMAAIDLTNAQPAQITVEDFADGATINITIQGVVNPVFGGKAFTLGPFNSSFNGGARAERTATTPFTAVVSNAFNAGVNTLDIGAKLNTDTAVALYSDGAYDGGFDVVFSY